MRRHTLSHIRELPETISIPDDGRVLFFKRDRDQFFWLSHFHAASIEIEGETWPTVEHYFQSRKSHDPEYRWVIQSCVHPGMAKRFGASPDGPRKIAGQSWFRTHGQKHRDDWRDVRLDIMRQADMAKFSQHPKLRELLISIGDAEIVEDTTMDDFWGIGPDGQGKNWAGRILMEVQRELRASRMT
ncbi:NADAR family protein [bacterium]|nr:NADAR family protein [bacterium]